MVEFEKKDAKLMKEIVAMSNTRKMLETFAQMKDTFVQTAQSFNLIRAEMERAKNIIWGLDVDNKKYLSEMTSLLGTDAMSFVAKVWDVKSNEVEDADAFEDLLHGIKNTSNPLLRMRKCTKARKVLSASIESWKSKIRGMKDRSDRADGNQNEAEICRRKIRAFEEVVASLEKRNETIFAIFHETKRDIESFVAKQSSQFVGSN